MPDNAIVKLGTGDDLQLYHNGTDSAIDNYLAIYILQIQQMIKI